MKKIDYFQHFKKCLFYNLSLEGFSFKGNYAWRSLNDAVVLIGIQKDARYAVEGVTRFTLDIYISIDALREAGGAMKPPFLGALAFDAFHWNKRLGHLLLNQNDMWWSISDEKTSQAACDDIFLSLRETALPKVYAQASSNEMVNCWQNGYGAGITEYVRRVKLAKLLLALGRFLEAKIAIQALEDAAIEKSWGASAVYDIKQLRQQLKSLSGAS